MTKQAKHTAGPWRVDPKHNCDIQTADGALEVASTHPRLLVGGETPHGAEPRANARLIAAAPDLLAAHKPNLQREIIHLLERHGEHEAANNVRAALQLADAATAKAEGR